MKRRFTSQDDVEWEAEATPVQPQRSPRAKFALIDDVPWRIQFTSDRPPYRAWADVPSDVGMGLMDLPREKLVTILNAAL